MPPRPGLLGPRWPSLPGLAGALLLAWARARSCLHGCSNGKPAGPHLLTLTPSLPPSPPANPHPHPPPSLLLFYFIGVSKVLQQLGVIKPGVTRVAGTSGGIIGCAPDFGIVDHDTFLKVGKEFVTRCRNRNNCAGQLDAEVSRVVNLILPPDAHKTVGV